MTKLAAKLRVRLNSETGATAVEYGIMVVLIAAVIVVVVRQIGVDVLAGFTTVDNNLP
jgi:pilus assembly protein Flp/PilA